MRASTTSTRGCATWRRPVRSTTRCAFTAETPGDVDALAAIARAAGARDIEGPEVPYVYERYYAVFFRDASGNRLEICYGRSHDDPDGPAVAAAAAEINVPSTSGRPSSRPG